MHPLEVGNRPAAYILEADEEEEESVYCGLLDCVAMYPRAQLSHRPGDGGRKHL
jgi:hypothetical protein